MVYFPNYSVYARKFFPEDITNPGRFTHILYAFAKIAADGTVALSDPWADLELPVDNANPAEDQPLGCIERLQLLKKESPGLQILLSVGGWGYRENFKLPSGNVVGRERFARSAVDLVSAHKLDGLDIDWEYPESEEQGENFHDLLKAIRVQLDNVTSASNRLLLTAAVSSSQLHYQHLPIERIEDEKLLDYWLLMGYDYAGSFSATAAHASNVYPGNGDKVTPFNTEQGVDAYHQRTVPLNKIILGMPLYGHDFQNTEGLGHSYRGNSLGSWPVQGENASGIWDYKVEARSE